MRIPVKVSKKFVGMIIRSRKTILNDGVMTISGIGDPNVYHALIVIFLEFFAWGLLIMPIIAVLNDTFPDYTFLMNGIIMGIKGFLSFLSAPLIGALSDVWGRKFFLLITVFFTCAPIPLMTINTWWFFAMISISGIFAVTFSVVFAYVADVTEEHERSLAYGLVSATFAASLVISPALGAYLMTEYSNNLVVALATAIAILDVLFILVAVPESLPEKVRPSSWGPSISWEQADPFQALRKVGKDYTILMLCTTVFLSYLPEAGQYSCIFVYLRLVIGFSVFNVAVYIAIIGILSVAAQTLLCFSMRSLGPKRTIMIGLLFEMLQLMWYGFGSQLWMMWAAGILASISSITYPAISAFVSLHSEADKQGLVQGMVTGMRGLCNGLGPAMFGIIFYLFHVDLDGKPVNTYNHINKTTENVENSPKMIPGPPFVFGAMLVVCALLVAEFIPSDSNSTGLKATSRRQSGTVFDSCGGSPDMFGTKMESSQEDEDLEDGEIASDDEEPSENAAPEKDKSEDKSDKIGEVGVAAPVGLSTKLTGNLSNEDNDFEKDLQRLKEDVERKKNRKDAKKRREIEKEGRRKRKAPDDNKNRKEKKRKVEGSKGGEKTEEEDVDEDEMLGLCIRGASPTINLDQVEVWSGKQPINEPNWQFNENSENESDFDDRDEKKRRRRDKDKRGFKSNSREDREIKKRLQMKRKGKNRKDAENSDMICINFMKGNCNKGNDCFYSHAVCPPKKMELCKFYLMDCCAKRDKCLYLHEEFPCKFFHTGLKCYSGKKCKFSHDPLNSLSKDILLKHLETAPKEILGDFPRLSRDCAETMVNNKTTGKPSDTSKIPSLFDIQVSIPPEFQIAGEKGEERTTPPCSPPPNVKTSPKTKSKEGIKFYQESAELLDPERERQAGSPLDFAKELEAYKNKQMLNKNSEVSIQKKSSHWSPRGSPEMKGINLATHFEKELEREEQFHRRNRRHNEDAELEEPSEKDMCKRKRRKHEDRRDRRGKMKENEENEEDRKKSRKDRKKDSKSPKSDNDPVRLNEDGTFGGIKFKIINRKEIRKSSDSEKDVLLPMKIEKPNEFLSSDDEKPLNYFIKKDKKEIIEDKTSDEGEKFGVEIKPDVEDETDENEPENPLIIETNDDQEEDEKPEEVIVPKHLPKKQQELFLRIQAQNQKIKDEENRKKEEWGRDRRVSVESGSGSEAEVGKTPSPEPADENWYSSDDEDIVRKESPLKTVLQTLSTDKKPFGIECSSKEVSFSTNQGFLLSSAKPKIELTSLSGPDLSKINITELLSSIRQVTNKKSQPSTEASLKAPVVPLSVSYEPPKIENPIKINYFNSDSDKKEVKDPRLRDPRINAETSRKNSEEKPAPGKSIYDCANFKVEFQDSDLRFQLKMDSDERIKPLDSIVPFGDVDLRNLGGQSDQSDCDFDMRKFGLPFKPVPVHSAATEIDASLNSHPPINYKVEAIYIPRPDFSSIKVSPSDPQVKRDPRLRRLFRISSSEAEPKEDQQKKSSLPSDPRQRKPALADTPKSPTESPFSPKQSEPVLANQSLLNANLLLLAQLGLSAAAAGTNVFDPRVQQLLNKTPQELEMLRNQLTKIKTQSDSDIFRNQLMNTETPDLIRPQSQGLLPTPIGAPGMGLLGPAPGFMMPGITVPDPSTIMGPMGQMGQNPIAFDPRFASNSKDEDGNDSDARHFNRGFRNERRGRGSWRGNRDRNWDRDNRRHNKRDDRDRNRHNRDRDDRRERKRSTSPD